MENFNQRAAYDWNDQDDDITPHPTLDDHGTPAAGLCCGARNGAAMVPGDDAYCGVGVAFLAHVTGIRLLGAGTEDWQVSRESERARGVGREGGVFVVKRQACDRKRTSTGRKMSSMCTRTAGDPPTMARDWRGQARPLSLLVSVLVRITRVTHTGPLAAMAVERAIESGRGGKGAI
jgi:hypothetical protein